MKKLKMHTPDISSENIDKVAEIFPSCLVETKDEKTGEVRRAIDFDQLRQELSDRIVDGTRERYRLDWPGKREALLAANTPTANTFRPCRKESVQFERTKNIFIEGDNLDALKLLQETYLGKVKLIYIDPPYNTGKDFIYKDSFKSTQLEQELKTGERSSAIERLVANPETNGRFHSNWLNMFYARVKLAKNLLSDDGIVFLSIDDNELQNAIKVFEEVFGADQYIACLPTIMNLKGNNDQFAFAGTHEYTLVFAKNKTLLKVGEFILDEEELEEWENDEIGQYKRGANLKATGTNGPRERRPNLFFPLYITEKDEVCVEKPNSKHIVVLPITDGIEMSWRWSKEKFRQSQKDVIISRNENTISLYKKQRPEIGELPSKKPKTLFYKPEYSSGNGTAEIKELFGAKLFDVPPKPPKLIEDIIQIGCPEGGIVLDFFAGSGTTGQAVMSVAKKTGKKLKYILIQLDEKVPEQSLARKYEFKTISEITKQRLRLAGKKMLTGESHTEWDKDIGFRVLKVDTSNMEDVYYAPDEVTQDDLVIHTDNIKSGRTSEDLLFQVLVDWGVDLSLPIHEETVAQKKVFFVDGNALAACFDFKVSEELVKELAKRKPLRAVFRDGSFENDSGKINVEQIFKLFSPETEVKTL